LRAHATGAPGAGEAVQSGPLAGCGETAAKPGAQRSVE